jgi:predicted extracellular nuclease
MKKLLLSIFGFVATLNFAQAQCNELFISEYVEGTSNNKAIEIYNPTSNSIGAN